MNSFKIQQIRSLSSGLGLLVLMAFLSSGQAEDRQTPPSQNAETQEESVNEAGKAEIPVSEDVAALPEAPRTADEGIEVRVEKSSDGAGNGNASSDIKIYSPYPAKPMTAPAGWQYVPAPDAISPFKQSVKLGTGNSVDLSITPFILVPDSDGANIFSIREPGYDPSLNFTQQHTIGAMLRASTMQIEEHEKQAAKAISRLQQLLSSLPRK